MTLVYRRRQRAKMKSKKTNIEQHKPKTKRKNPVSKRSDLLLRDPIFMHHMLACLSRCVELMLPGETGKIDAGYHLITPEGTGGREGGQK